MALMNQLLALQQSMSGAQGFSPSSNQVPNSYSSASSSSSTADSPLQSKCYNKAGYAVLISNGYLCESTSDKGVVMMESGTQFCIAIANDNDYAAEVDITFGGMYLGVVDSGSKAVIIQPFGYTRFFLGTG
ncbi:hypothetical protein OS493_026725 [Desmophyllum pertusum]|uniref:Uncharacterized protein n=1 Tax=Desmophyllum pertusum TaxID=174260 RepID=A0A9W9ZZ79_9CNID|nr:hypothetical protein OS493_026725 [Desmophyllum pertusum]